MCMPGGRNPSADITAQVQLGTWLLKFAGHSHLFATTCLWNSAVDHQGMEFRSGSPGENLTATNERKPSPRSEWGRKPAVSACGIYCSTVWDSVGLRHIKYRFANALLHSSAQLVLWATKTLAYRARVGFCLAVVSPCPPAAVSSRDPFSPRALCGNLCSTGTDV
jgi:hypothetical protein